MRSQLVVPTRSPKHANLCTMLRLDTLIWIELIISKLFFSCRCADIIKHRTKQMLMFLLVLSTISQLIFSLSCAGILPSKKPILFTSIIFGGLVYNGTLPLFFELAMECVYPFGESIAGSLLVTMGNVVLMLFYIAFMLPHSDVRWMNWVTVTGLGVCVLGLLIYREKYTRLEIDARSNVSNRDLGNTGESKPLPYPAS